jgi:hypothetical protein
LWVAASDLGVLVGEGRKLCLLNLNGTRKWSADIPRPGEEVEEWIDDEAYEWPTEHQLRHRLRVGGADQAVLHVGFLRVQRCWAVEPSEEKPYAYQTAIYDWSAGPPPPAGVEEGSEQGIEVAVGLGGLLDGESISSVAASPERLFVGMSTGWLHVLDEQGRHLNRFQLGRGPVSWILLDRGKLRATYGAGLLTQFAQGHLVATVRLPEYWAQLELAGGEVVAWNDKTAWLVDERGYVPFKAAFANRIGATVAGDGRLWILAGKLRCFQDLGFPPAAPTGPSSPRADDSEDCDGEGCRL